MAYTDVFLLFSDRDFYDRCTAAVALEGETINPTAWVSQYQWELAATPGFGEAYAYALATGNERPGWDATVITDAQILSRIQQLRPLPPEPPVFPPVPPPTEEMPEEPSP